MPPTKAHLLARARARLNVNVEAKPKPYMRSPDRGTNESSRFDEAQWVFALGIPQLIAERRVQNSTDRLTLKR